MGRTKQATLKPWAPARGSSWRPLLGRPGQSGSDIKRDIGLAMLSALSITSVWSAVCPSFFTMATFASRPEARSRAVTGCWIGFGLSTATAAAIYFAFDELLPALFAEATAVALLAISMYAIHSEAPKEIEAMDRQPEAMPSSARPIALAQAV